MKPRYPRPRKRFGQNFLYDPAIAGRIADAARVRAGHTVLELGPGRGILTDALVARGAHVIAVEIDTDLADVLAARYAEDEVTVVRADLVETSPAGLLGAHGVSGCILVGNIPYYLTREVLFRYLVDGRDVLEHAVVMMQKEVGERVVAPPGSRVYGITSVLLQSLYKVSIKLRVASGSFFPKPRVDSVVLGFDPRENPLVAPGEFESFRWLVRGVFAQRRKTIQSTLKSNLGLPGDRVQTATVDAGVDTHARPEQLSVNQFLALSRAITNAGKGSGGTL